MKRVTIPEGRHKPRGLSFAPNIFRNRIGYTVLFTESCRYALPPPDDKDLNKLPGLSQGFHHWNSARVGWRYNSNKGVIELFAYCYAGGENIYTQRLSQLKEQTLWLGDYPLNQEVDIEIYIDTEAYQFRVNGIAEVEVERGKWPNIGYQLNHYFGGKKDNGKGDNVAPHDIILYQQLF